MNTSQQGRHRSAATRQTRRAVLAARTRFIYGLIVGALVAAATAVLTTALIAHQAWLLVAIAVGVGTFLFLTIRDIAYVWGDQWFAARRAHRNACAELFAAPRPPIVPTRLACADDLPTDAFPAVIATLVDDVERHLAHAGGTR